MIVLFNQQYKQTLSYKLIVQIIDDVVSCMTKALID